MVSPTDRASKGSGEPKAHALALDGAGNVLGGAVVVAAIRLVGTGSGATLVMSCAGLAARPVATSGEAGAGPGALAQAAGAVSIGAPGIWNSRTWTRRSGGVGAGSGNPPGDRIMRQADVCLAGNDGALYEGKLSHVPNGF
jgi:hypothetical protein